MTEIKRELSPTKAQVSKTPLSPRVSKEEHAARVAAAVETLKAVTALEAVEGKRAKAQAGLEEAEDQLNNLYEQTSQAYQNLQKSFSPPATPSRSRVTQAAQQSGRVGTPARNIRSGSVIPISPKSVPPAALTPWYVVLHGRNSCQGLFEGYDSGARALTQGYAFRLFKKFSTEAEGRRCYEECDQTGVLDLLRPVPAGSELFIVIEGVIPGVYGTRLKLMIEGLGWRGGKVVAVQGTRSEAKALFEEWERQGETKVLKAGDSRTLIYISDSDDDDNDEE